MSDHRYAYLLVFALIATLATASTMIAGGAIPQVPKDYAWVGVLLGVFTAAITTRLPAWGEKEKD